RPDCDSYSEVAQPFSSKSTLRYGRRDVSYQTQSSCPLYVRTRSGRPYSRRILSVVAPPTGDLPTYFAQGLVRSPTTVTRSRGSARRGAGGLRTPGEPSGTAAPSPPGGGLRTSYASPRC